MQRLKLVFGSIILILGLILLLALLSRAMEVTYGLKSRAIGIHKARPSYADLKSIIQKSSQDSLLCARIVKTYESYKKSLASYIGTIHRLRNISRTLLAAGSNLLNVNISGYNKFKEIIVKAAEIEYLDPALIAAVIQIESNFDPNAVSYAGCYGLMQIRIEKTSTPLAADLWGWSTKDSWKKYAFDPEMNIYGGSNYIKNIISMLETNHPNYEPGYDLKFMDYTEGLIKTVYASYNYGPYGVQHLIKSGGYTRWGQLKSMIPGSIITAADKVYVAYNDFLEVDNNNVEDLEQPGS